MLQSSSETQQMLNKYLWKQWVWKHTMMKRQQRQARQRALEPQKWLYFEPQSNSNGENGPGRGSGRRKPVPGAAFVPVRGAAYRVRVAFPDWASHIQIFVTPIPAFPFTQAWTAFQTAGFYNGFLSEGATAVKVLQWSVPFSLLFDISGIESITGMGKHTRESFALQSPKEQVSPPQHHWYLARMVLGCGREAAVLCVGMLSNISGLYPLDTNSTLSQVGATKNDSTHCQIAPLLSSTISKNILLPPSSWSLSPF